MVSGADARLVVPGAAHGDVRNAARLGGYALGAVSAFGSAHLWVPVVLPLVIIPGVVVGLGLGAHYRRVRIRQADLERAMEHGLSRQAFERLEGVLGGMSAGRTVFAVCMCSDIEGYTTISEALSPKATRDVLNRYLEMFIPRIEASGATSPISSAIR